MNNQHEIRKRLVSLFMPHAMSQLEKLKQQQPRHFAHYTSAHAAMQIIDNRRIWMRNAIVMNDFSEVQHGQKCIRSSWDDQSVGGRLRKLLDHIYPGLAGATEENFERQVGHREMQSYMVSLSEHGEGALNEDEYGRLSMWRAYGGDTNVAFVFNTKAFISQSTALPAFLSPVLYCDEPEFKRKFVEMIEGLENNISFLKSTPPKAISETLTSALHFAALSSKHPGFAEEREWRVIHSPTMAPSERIKFDVETIGGVPQRVYKLRMENYPDEGFTGATLPELVAEVIIGPTAYPWPIYEAIVTKLQEAGCEDAENKVRVSEIPLRR